MRNRLLLFGCVRLQRSLVRHVVGKMIAARRVTQVAAFDGIPAEEKGAADDTAGIKKDRGGASKSLASFAPAA